MGRREFRHRGMHCKHPQSVFTGEQLATSDAFVVDARGLGVTTHKFSLPSFCCIPTYWVRSVLKAICCSDVDHMHPSLALSYSMTWHTAFEWPSQCWLPIVTEEDSLSWSCSFLLEGPCSIPWLPEQRHCKFVQVCAERAASIRVLWQIDQALCAIHSKSGRRFFTAMQHGIA